MKYCLIFSVILLSCTEMEEIKVPVGCECNKGWTLDFSREIFTDYPTDFILEDLTRKKKVPNHYTTEHCNATTLWVCGSTMLILDQGGVKRFIYNRSELE